MISVQQSSSRSPQATLVRCGSDAEYGHVAARWIGVHACAACARTMPLPVLGQSFAEGFELWALKRGLDHVSFAALADAPRDCRHDPAPSAPDRGVVLHDADPALVPMATLLAHATGRRLQALASGVTVRESLAGVAADASVCLVALWDRADAARLTELAELTLERSIGMVLAHDAEELSRAIAKTIHLHHVGQEDGRFRCFVQNSTLDAQESETGIVVRDGGGMAAPDIQEVLETLQHRYVGVLGHGGNIDVTLNPQAAALCGRTDRPLKPGQRLHYCQQQDRCSRAEINQRTRVPMQRVDADVVFLFTCGGFGGASTVYPEELSLARAALSGHVTAYASPIAVSGAPDWLPAYFGALVKSGRTLGEATREASMLACSASGLAPHLVLSGDPALRIAPSPSAAPGHWRAQAIEDGVRLTGTLMSGHVADIDLNSLLRSHALPELPADQDATLDVLVFDADGQDAPGDAAVQLLRGAAGLRCVMFATETLESRKVEVEVRTLRARRHEISARLRRWQRNEYMLQGMHRIHQTSRSKALDRGRVDDYELALDTLIAGVGKAKDVLKQAFLEPVNANQMNVPAGSRDRLVRDACEVMDVAQAAALRTFADWRMRFDFSEKYGVMTFPTNDLAGASCDYCGSATRLAHHEAFERGDVVRERRYCQRCSIISDIDVDMPRARVACPDQMRRGSRLDVEVVFEQVPADLNVFGSLAIEGRVPWVSAQAAPSGQRLPQGSDRLQFTLTVPEDAVAGTYFLIFMYACDFGLSALTRPIIIL